MLQAEYDRETDETDHAWQPHATANELALVRRWLKWLTVAMFAVAAALLFVVAAVFGAVIDFHRGEGILIAGASCGGAAVGFILGWLARRAI